MVDGHSLFIMSILVGSAVHFTLQRGVFVIGRVWTQGAAGLDNYFQVEGGLVSRGGAYIRHPVVTLGRGRRVVSKARGSIMRRNMAI